jgi:hypothetical protein
VTNRYSLAALMLLAAAQAGVAQQPTVLNFDADAAGALPAGFSFAHTANRGKPGVWAVRADDAERKNVLAQTGTDPVQMRLPVAVADSIVAADVDVSVRYKPVAGKVDMAAGLVWRYQDADNYYIVRANALEDNVVLYKVLKGVRIDLPLVDGGRTYGAKSPVPKNKWSTLRVVADGNLFTVFNNGQELFKVRDETFKAAGKVGVWTKADSVTYFDDLSITKLR